MGSAASGSAESFWRGHVEAWRLSGQSRRDYCAAQGLSRKTFDWWAWRLDRMRPAAVEAGAVVGFVPVEITVPCEAGEAGSAGMARGDERIEITLGDGVTVRVGSGFQAGALRRVLEALGR